MTDAAELTFAVLQKVGQFLKTLPADQLQDLADGTAKLELVPKGGRPAPRAKAAPAKTASADDVRTALLAINDRGAAIRYLEDLKLLVPGYRKLAQDLGVTVATKSTKAAIVDAIAERFVGRRLDSEAIRRR